MISKFQTEDAQHESFETYQELIETFPVAMGVESDNKIIFINNAGARLLGASGPEHLIGRKVVDFIASPDKDLVEKQFDRIRGGTEHVSPFDVKVSQAKGKDIDVEIEAASFSFHNKPAIQFSLRDISKRKKMEELIYQSKQDWEETFHAITDMITVHDKDFNIIYANKAAEKILRLTALDGNPPLKCYTFYHGTDCPPRGCPSCDCLNTGVPANFEIFEPHLNMHVEIRSMPRYDSNNQMIGLIHIARDVTERKKALETIQKARDGLELRVQERTAELSIMNEQLKGEIGERKAAVEALKKSETKYRNLSQEFNTLLNGIPDNLILLSPDLKIMWANKAVAALNRKNISDLAGEYCYSMCCNIISPCDDCPTLRSFVSGKEETAEISTGDDTIWDVRAFPIKDEEGNVRSVIELARDVTEKANLEAGATRTRHLASLGELAAGVAHEINNPINNILNYGQLLLDEFKDEHRDDELPRRIIRDGDRIATIVKSLLSFARIRKEEKCLMPLHEIFSDTLSLTSAQLRKDGIHLKVDIPSRAIKVPLHPQQIQQVFLNLISNSRYSLNEKYPQTHENKILDIKCQETVIDGEPYARITFHDNGTGIPAAIIDKVVNPFFSTKPNRVGTGLGLSISHGIISEHGGKLLINSSEGEYTKIIINLPMNGQSEE